MVKLKEIENEIIEIHEYDLPFSGTSLAGTKEWKGKQLNILEARRRFLLDRRESWLPKTIWNLIIPILASIVTTIVLKNI